jgi:hypothetical protein
MGEAKRRKDAGEPMAETNELMQTLAGGLDQVLNGQKFAANPVNGFVLLVFPFGEIAGARTNYVSNCNRDDIVVALKEILARFEGQAEVSGNA